MRGNKGIKKNQKRLMEETQSKERKEKEERTDERGSKKGTV